MSCSHNQSCSKLKCNHNRGHSESSCTCKCLPWQTCNVKLVEDVTIFDCVIVYDTMHNSFFQILTNDWSSSIFWFMKWSGNVSTKLQRTFQFLECPPLFFFFLPHDTTTQWALWWKQERKFDASFLHTVKTLWLWAFLGGLRSLLYCALAIILVKPKAKP